MRAYAKNTCPIRVCEEDLSSCYATNAAGMTLLKPSHADAPTGTNKAEPGKPEIATETLVAVL